MPGRNPDPAMELFDDLDTELLLGTRLFDGQIAWLSRARGIILLLDDDHAGRDASSRVAQSLQALTTVYTHLPPDNKESEDLSDQSPASIVQKYPLSF